MHKKLVFSPLEPWQEDVYNQVHNARGSGKIFVVKSRRQIGKSTLAAILLIEFAVKQKCVSVVVEPTQNQSRRMYKQITDMLSTSGLIVSANSQLLTIELWNGSEILFKSAEQRDALRGFSVSGLLVIDEASFIQENIFEILYPTCDANNAPMLIISTPLFCSGEFYNLYSRGGDGRIVSFNWSEYDTSKYLSKEKLEYYRSTLSTLKFRSEYLGEFITEGSYVFGDINRCISELSYSSPVYAGIDWGNGGENDYTVLVFLNDSGNVVSITAFNNIAPTQQIEQLSGIINGTPGLERVCVEMNSIGTVYCDMLKKKIKTPIREFVTTNDSKRKVVERLITAFQNQEITIPYDEELLRELQHYAMEKTSKGYTYNGADGVNDDYVIALSLAWDTYERRIGRNCSLSFA